MLKKQCAHFFKQVATTGDLVVVVQLFRSHPNKPTLCRSDEIVISIMIEITIPSARQASKTHDS